MRVNLSVCPKGIEVLDTVTGETLHGIAINRISYCSADGAYSKVFAFVASGSGGDSRADSTADSADADDLTCYAFLCGKRKMAHNLTITVAKNFERAFNLWKKFEHTKANAAYRVSDDATEQRAQHDGNDARRPADSGRDNVLIDFGSDAMQATQRRLLQTAWVSFDEESATGDSKQPRMIEWQRNLVF